MDLEDFFGGSDPFLWSPTFAILYIFASGPHAFQHGRHQLIHIQDAVHSVPD